MDSGKEVTDGMASVHPIKRLATREEVAGLAAYLQSERAAFITGNVHLLMAGTPHSNATAHNIMQSEYMNEVSIRITQQENPIAYD